MPLGKTFIKNPVKLIGSLTFEHWARLLFFTDLFILLNQQMNDREFYGTTSESQPESKLWNPLDINQLQTFLKQLCTIVYDLDRVPEIGAHAPVTRGKIDWTRLTARLKDSLVVLYCRELRRPRQPPEVSESGKETTQDDSDADDAQSGMMSKEEVAALLERAKSPREKLLESDPTCFHEILAQLDLEDNIAKFRYFSWPERMPREVVFPQRLGNFYLMRFERLEDEFNRTKSPDRQHYGEWSFFHDTCNQIIQCYEAALDLAPPIYPAMVDLRQKLAFMYLSRFKMLWYFKMGWELDDCRRASVHLQNALELDGSFSCLKRTIEIGRWVFHSFTEIVGMMKHGYLNTSHADRFSQTALFRICHGPELEKLAQDVAMFGDHPAISHAILNIKQNVEIMTPDSLEPLASWYFQRYRGRQEAEDLDDAIAMQTNALMQRIKARDKERFDEQREVEDESEKERDNDEALQQVENSTSLTIEVDDVAADMPKPKPKPRKKTSDMDVVNCGHQLALWLKIRYEMRHSIEDLNNLRKLLLKMVMSYPDPGGIFECAFIFSRLPPPLQLPYGLYDQAILALHSLVIMSLTLMAPDLLLRFHDSIVFVGDIVAMALRDNNLIKALEWLENSRCLIWSNLSSLEEAPPVWLKLGQADIGPSLLTVGIRAREAIRQGLLKYTYVDGNQVVRHLTDGPIILLNASAVGCDALVLRPNVGPQRLPLATLSFDQVTAWGKTFISLLSRLGALFRGDERKDRPSKRTPDDGDDEFQSLLEEIWVALVEPILNFVWGGNDSTAMSENQSLPRIWWCCTGPFSVLPIHAAGLYTSFGPQLRLSDFTVSSYITSLSLFTSCPPADPPADFKLLVIAQPSTPDLPPLPGVTEEASNIMERANSLQTIVLNGERATSAAVMAESASAPWVHAACHGRQSGIWSGFALHDGLLQLQTLASLPGLSQTEFAFLSACETATGDGHLSGEALHLAGSLHRLGYRSVIATLFSVRDRDAPFVADKVYEQLFKDERPNYRKAAQALHRAIHLLQEANGRGNFRAWVPFIHIGM